MRVGVVVGVVASLSVAHASELRHQGRLLAVDGAPLQGPMGISVTLWTAQTGGQTEWNQTYQVVLEDGYFAVDLGLAADNKPIEQALIQDQAVWLEVSANGSTLPRQRLVPLALAAEYVINRRDGSSQDHSGRTCKAILDATGTTKNGLFWIDPNDDGDTTDAFRTWCDMTGGGWTLVMQNNRAVSNRLDPSWAETVFSTVVRGGALSGNIGSFDILVALDLYDDIGTEARLTVGNVPGVIERSAVFSSFTLNAADEYRLSISTPTLTGTTLQPGLSVSHNNQRWATIDNTNGAGSENCPANYGHPWWYTNCWNGALWGSNRDHTPKAYWVGSTNNSDAFEWGALWLR